MCVCMRARARAFQSSCYQYYTHFPKKLCLTQFYTQPLSENDGEETTADRKKDVV
jgi:hypothetical protein